MYMPAIAIALNVRSTASFMVVVEKRRVLVVKGGVRIYRKLRFAQIFQAEKRLG